MVLCRVLQNTNKTKFFLSSLFCMVAFGQPVLFVPTIPPQSHAIRQHTRNMAQNQPYSHPHPHRHSYQHQQRRQQRRHRMSHTSLQPVTSFVATLTNNPSIPRPCKYQLSPRGCHFDTDCWYAHYSFQHEYQPSTNDAHIQQQLKKLRQQILELTDLVKSLPSAETALSLSLSFPSSSIHLFDLVWYLPLTRFT